MWKTYLCILSAQLEVAPCTPASLAVTSLHLNNLATSVVNLTIQSFNSFNMHFKLETVIF